MQIFKTMTLPWFSVELVVEVGEIEGTIVTVDVIVVTEVADVLLVG